MITFGGCPPLGQSCVSTSCLTRAAAEAWDAVAALSGHLHSDTSQLAPEEVQ